MGKRVILFLVIITVSLVIFYACEDEEGEEETLISSHFITESHKAGNNCMTCHVSGGTGEGWFTVAGTVYGDDKNTVYPNGTVKLFTGPDGTGDLIGTIEVDGKGNFYTTETINFGEGLYTLVEGDLGTKHMTTRITTGACNSCHGNSTDRIWVE